MRFTSRYRRAMVAAALSLVSSAIAVSPAIASHGFNPSAGIYRIPYLDGSDVTITADHHDHGGPDGAKDRIDMTGDTLVVVAAASGIVRAVVDFNGEDFGRGDGVDSAGSPQDDTLEHSCQDLDDMNGDAIPNSVVFGLCQDYNNYVWVQHPNGEWTKYTHIMTGTASIDFGWVVGEAINVGDVVGIQGDVGRATGPHLHWEVAVPTDSTDLTPFSTLGGFIQGANRTPIVCDIPNNLYVTGDTYTAAPCLHLPPVAEAGGPYSVDEGSQVALDGSASHDGDGGTALTYLWDPSLFGDGSTLSDVTLAQPTFDAVEGPNAFNITLTVFDQIEQISDSDTVTINIANVSPTVSAVGDTIDEAGTATVAATFTDPGVLDSHVATIQWGDGTVSAVTVATLSGGVNHVYGDNGTYSVTVTVTDDDGDAGVDIVSVVVNNLDPSLTLDLSDVVSFPGGDYLVTEPSIDLPVSASGSDPGSDDLTFGWTTGEINPYYNDGIGPEPPEPPTPTPFGTFPFFAGDVGTASFSFPGVENVGLELSDDDGGSADASVAVIVTGTADGTEGQGWWKHQYSGKGKAHIDPALASAYLEIVIAVSSVFSEQTTLATTADAHSVLSPTGNDKRARAESELLQAWLHFASGAVSWDATVDLNTGPIGLLDLMETAEAAILNPASTSAELQQVIHDLARVRHT